MIAITSVSDDFFFTLAFSHISPAKLFLLEPVRGRRVEGARVEIISISGRKQRTVQSAQMQGGAGCIYICYMEVHDS